MTADRLGIVMVGAGFIASIHATAIAASRRASLVGIVDTDPGRAAGFAKAQGGIRFTTDLAEALVWPEVDAAIVCTPNSTHASVGAVIADAGKHLLIEKPLATTVADAQALAGRFSRAGLVLTAAHTHRSYDYGLAVKRSLDSGLVGRASFARLTLLGTWIWPDWSAWAINAEMSGGHALHNGVHLLDLVTWWLDAEPVTIYARGAKQTSAEIDIYDYLEMLVGYADGSSALCEMSRAHRPSVYTQPKRDLLVLGSEGILSQEWDGESAVLVGETGTSGVPAAGHDGFARQLESWLDTIAGLPPSMPIADAVRAVAMGVAVEESIATGRPVELDSALWQASGVAA